MPVTEIIIKYYNLDAYKSSYMKLKKIIRKITEENPTIMFPLTKEGYTKVTCLISRPLILEKSRLMEKIEKEICDINEMEINKEDFGIEIRRQ